MISVRFIFEGYVCYVFREVGEDIPFQVSIDGRRIGWNSASLQLKAAALKAMV